MHLYFYTCNTPKTPCITGVAQLAMNVTNVDQGTILASLLRNKRFDVYVLFLHALL